MALTVKYLTVDGEILSETRSGTRSDYIPDPLGSTAGLISSTHTISDTFLWWPYGELRNHTGASTTPLGHVGTQGYYANSNGTSTYIRSNTLMAKTSQWLTQDPLWPSELGFVVVLSNPTSQTDPSGEATRPRRPIGITGGGSGPCVVYVCYENTGPVSSIPGHESICVTGPNGGCSGGLYPTGNPVSSPGEVLPNRYPCRSGWNPTKRGGTEKVKCVPVATDCESAIEACKCIKEFSENPPTYTLGYNNCYRFASAVVDCLGRGSGASMFPLPFQPPPGIPGQVSRWPFLP